MLESKTATMNFLYLPFTLLLQNVESMQMMILGWLIIIDFVTGIIKSYVLSISITKKRALEGILLKATIFTIPFVIVLLAKGVGIDAKEYVFYIIGLLIVAESYGILGNIQSIRKKELVEEKDLINILLQTLRNGLTKRIPNEDEISNDLKKKD